MRSTLSIETKIAKLKAEEKLAKTKEEKKLKKAEIEYLESTAEKIKAENEEKAAKKEEEKERKRIAREAEKEQKRLEREAEREQKRLDKEAEKAKRREERMEQRRGEALAARERKISVIVREIEKYSGTEMDDLSWLDYLEFDDDGILAGNLTNVLTVVNFCPLFGDNLRKNELTGLYEWNGKTMTDEMENSIYLKIYRITRIDNERWVRSAIMETASKNTYHPLMEYVEGLVWDGRERLQDFFIKRLGAADTELTREITFKWFMAIWKRVKEPGCVFDHYLAVSDPKQGTGKTKCFEKLVSEIGFGNLISSNITTKTNDQNNVMNINSIVIGLFDESSQTKYTALEEFKTFVTTRAFKVRLPWGRNITDFPVHCVYAVTTNDDKFLTDTTSAEERRAWVLLCDGNPNRTFDEWDALNNKGEIEQVWAEICWWWEHQEDAPWDISGNNISRLTDSNTKALYELQAGVKTSGDDYATIDAIETVVTQQYTRDGSVGDEFANAQEFIMDTTDFGLKDKPRKPLKRVRVDYFANYVSKIAYKGGAKNKSQKYILQVFQNMCAQGTIGEWEVKREQRDKARHTYIVRKEPRPQAETGGDLLENTKKNAEKTAKNTKKTPKITPIFGENYGKFGDDMGDLWVQNTTKNGENDGENGFEVDF